MSELLYASEPAELTTPKATLYKCSVVANIKTLIEDEIYVRTYKEAKAFILGYVHDILEGKLTQNKVSLPLLRETIDPFENYLNAHEHDFVSLSVDMHDCIISMFTIQKTEQTHEPNTGAFRLKGLYTDIKVFDIRNEEDIEKLLES